MSNEMNKEMNKKGLVARVMDRPILAGMIGIAGFFAASNVFALITRSQMVTMLLVIGSMIAAYAVFKKCYHVEHNLSVKGFFKGFLLTVPLWLGNAALFVVALLNAKNSLTMDYVMLAVVNALQAGICEEIVCRGLFVGNAMRNKNNADHIMKYAFISSAIFGMLHLVNLIQGAGICSTISQVMYATGLGLVFCAVYYRTGSLLPCMVAHFIFDCSSFLSRGMAFGASNNVAVIKDNGSAMATLAQGAFIFVIGAAYAMFLLRKKKREQIRERLVFA